MSLSRAISKSICRGLIGLLLFAQFAVASYACPSLSAMRAIADSGPVAHSALAMAQTTPASADLTGMPPGCDQIDPDAANLCVEHCHHGQQSVDAAMAPALPSAIPILLYSHPVIEPAHAPGYGRTAQADHAGQAASPPPPHAILHCVFRI